jgi:hypothetical protein
VRSFLAIAGKEAVPKPQVGKVGSGRALLLLAFTCLSILHGAQSRAVAAALLLGNGSQTNHLLILFAPGQVAQYELRHDGSVQTGAQLLTAVIQATGGLMLVTQANDEDGQTISFSSQAAAWNGQGLFAHFYQYSFGMFVNGFAAGSFAAAADGSWTSYFTYQIAGEDGAFISAPVGASDRILAHGDHDAYVLTSTHPSPGLAAWCTAHAITDLGADADGDGLDHLQEYALRKDPHKPDSLGVIQSGILENNGETFLTLSYRRPHDENASVPPGADAGFDGIGYTVEASTDLVTWHSGPPHVTHTVIPDTSGPMATVTAHVRVDTGKVFLRLRIQGP